MDKMINVMPAIDSSVSSDVSIAVPGGMMDGGYYEGMDGISDEMSMGGLVTEASVTKDPIMSSWLFVGGITAAVLAVSIVLGILLAKIRIKKGFDPYEI